MIILSGIYGIMGVLSAGPVADGLAFVLAVILLVKETRNMKNDGVETEKAERKETESLQSQYPQKNCDCPVGAAGSELPVCRL